MPYDSIFLMGATATGKTDLAVAIAESYPVELISVDSAMVYREMDIGTAKPEPELLERVPHFLVNIIDPDESFSAWEFVEKTRVLMRDIQQRGNVPLLVGGTMLYFNALEFGLNQLPQADAEVRSRLVSMASKIGWSAMHDRLAQVDPKIAERIKPGDSQRIQRALEVYEITGQPLSALQQQQSAAFQGNPLRLILAAEDRSALHERIEKRYRVMLEQGFVEEVEALRARGDLNLEMPSMRCVGYRQIWQYLDGELSYEAMVSKGTAATRQLAKRQITWLRKQPDENAVDCLNYRKDDIFNQLDAVLFRR